MNYIAATFHRILNKDYEAYIGLLYVMRTLNWRNFYLNKTPKLTNMCDLLFQSLGDHSEALLKHLSSQDLHPTACFSQTLLTLGIYSLPFPLACQVLDLFLLDGEQAIRKLIINSLMLFEQEILLTEDQLELYSLI